MIFPDDCHIDPFDHRSISTFALRFALIFISLSSLISLSSVVLPRFFSVLPLYFSPTLVPHHLQSLSRYRVSSSCPLFLSLSIRHLVHPIVRRRPEKRETELFPSRREIHVSYPSPSSLHQPRTYIIGILSRLHYASKHVPGIVRPMSTGGHRNYVISSAAVTAASSPSRPTNPPPSTLSA